MEAGRKRRTTVNLQKLYIEYTGVLLRVLCFDDVFNFSFRGDKLIGFEDCRLFCVY